MSNATDMTVAMLLSCDSFESFYGSVLGLDRDRFLSTYRNDWSWYYAQGLLDNNIKPILYIPSIQYDGLHELDSGIGVRFIRLARWYRPLARFRRAMRATRWSLYAQERVNAAAFVHPLNAALAADGAHLLYVQEYWSGRFDFLTSHVNLPISAADHGGLARGVVKAFKRKAFERAAAIYCQSRDECDQVRAYGGSPTLQPNGGDTSFFSPPVDQTQRGKNIVTIARLTNKQKLTSDLIRAMKLLDPQWTLDIIGTGPDREMLETLAVDLGVAERVRFRGFQDRESVRTYLQNCGVYAMPSANEALCIAMLEAMSCGAAVVGSRIRCFESLINPGVSGMLFPVGDVPALAHAIETAWAKRDTLGPAAMRAVKDDFDSKKLYRRLADSMRASAGCQPACPTAVELEMAGV